MRVTPTSSIPIKYLSHPPLDGPCQFHPSSAVDVHLENHQAIPLILEDLLMTFDNERTKALLPVLAELSKKTQVLIFTHHAHLKELMGEKVSVHELD